MNKFHIFLMVYTAVVVLVKDLISTRGRSRSAAILLGSVAEAVIVEARTPLVVKHFGAKLNLLETLLQRAFRRESPHFG